MLHRNGENFCWTMFHRAVPKAGQKMQRALGFRQSTPGTGLAVGELSTGQPIALEVVCACVRAVNER